MLLIAEMFDWHLDRSLRLEAITIKEKLRYEKDEWLKPYLEFKIHKRKEAKAKRDNIGNVVFKLNYNYFYG